MVICTIWDKQFTRKGSYKRHQLYVHQKLYTESCPVCVKNVRKDNLKGHMKTHTSPPDQVIQSNNDESNVQGMYNYTKKISNHKQYKFMYI